MDSLAQSLMWLAWETNPDAESIPAISTQTAAAGNGPVALPVVSALVTACRSRSLALTAGAIVLGSSLGSPALANSSRWGSTVYVNTPAGYALNVRWAPGTNSGVYRRVRRGSPLQVSGVHRNGWVQLIDATWVASNLVSTAPVEGAITPLPDYSGNLATVVTPQNFALNIRSGPGFNFPIVGQFVNGSRIPVTGRFSVGWAQLTNGNWVDSGHIQYSGPIQNINPPPTVPTQPTNPPPSADVKELQRLLRQANFLPANFGLSGVYDQTTQSAVREFQRVNGLPVTGTVDAATWNALYRATTPNPQPSPNPSPSPSPSPSPGPTQPPSSSRQMRVVTDSDSTPVFSGPGTEFGFVRTVPNGAIVTVTGNTSGNWSELLDGGWIFSPWLEPV